MKKQSGNMMLAAVPHVRSGGFFSFDPIPANSPWGGPQHFLPVRGQVTKNASQIGTRFDKSRQPAQARQRMVRLCELATARKLNRSTRYV